MDIHIHIHLNIATGADGTVSVSQKVESAPAFSPSTNQNKPVEDDEKNWAVWTDFVHTWLKGLREPGSVNLQLFLQKLGFQGKLQQIIKAIKTKNDLLRALRDVDFSADAYQDWTPAVLSKEDLVVRLAGHITQVTSLFVPEIAELYKEEPPQ